MHKSFTKRLAALMLALVLSLSLLPTAALAAEETVAADTVAAETVAADTVAAETVTADTVAADTVAADTVIISVETKTIDGADLIVPTSVPLLAGDDPIKLLTRIAVEKNIAIENPSGTYVTKIGDFGAMTHGNESGWMVSINNDHDTWPQPALKNGDTVRFCYTYKTYGHDIDLMDQIADLKALSAAAELKLTENDGNPFFEADGFMEAPDSKFTLLLAEYTAVSEKLAVIEAAGTPKDYLTALGTMIWGPGSESSTLSTLATRLRYATAGSAYVPATGATIAVAGSPSEFIVGNSYQLSAVILPETATNQTGQWQVLEITGKGTITPTGLFTPTAAGMITVQLWHPDAANGVLETQLITAKPKPLTPEETLSLLDAAITKVAATYAARDAAWWGGKYTGDWWHATAVGAYGAYRPADPKLITAESSQAFVNKSVGTVATKTGAESAWANTLANATNGLRALGYNPQNCFTAGNKMPVDTAALLKAVNLEEAQKGWFSTVAPYALLALRQGSYNSAPQQEALLTYLLANVEANSKYLDTYVMMLQGIAPFYATDSRAKAAIDAGLVTIATKQKDDGSFGNVATTAQVAILFAQLGILPTTDARFLKGEKNIVTSLIAAVKDNGSMGGNMNDSQGFAALLALAQTMKTKVPYSIYDASGYANLPAVATENSGETPTPPPVQPTTMTLRFTLKGDEVHGETAHSGSYPTWISGYSVTVPTDATVAYAVSAALKAQGFTFDESGLNGGYLKWIQSPNTGTRLTEFSNGPLSGWKYQVNGQAPTVGIANYVPENGDSILLYFTDNYTVEPDAEQWTPGGIAPKPEKPDGGTLAPTVTTDQNGSASVSVSREDSDAALEAVKKNGSAELVIAPNIKGDASKVQVTLPKAAVSGLANETTAALTVESNLAKISLSTAALTTLAAQSGGDVSITAEKVSTQDMSAENKALVGDHPVYNFSVSVGATAVREFGGKVTVKLPYTLKEGEDGENITIFYMDQDGKATEMAGAKYDAATKSIVFETNHFSTFAVVYHETKATFTDVNPGDWFASAVDFVTGKKLFAGTTATTFSPAANMNRAMLWTVLYRMDGSPKKTDNATWYADAQNWAIEEKISDGTKPAAAITRQELVAMLYRYAAIKKYDVTAVPALTAYEDAEMVSDWAKTPMAWGVGAGIITGRSETTLTPADTASRGEVAVMVQRFLAATGQ